MLYWAKIKIKLHGNSIGKNREDIIGTTNWDFWTLIIKLYKLFQRQRKLIYNNKYTMNMNFAGD